MLKRDTARSTRRGRHGEVERWSIRDAQKLTPALEVGNKVGAILLLLQSSEHHLGTGHVLCKSQDADT